MGITEPEIDPNVNFNAALAAAQRRRAAAEPDPQRDDTGEPVEPAGQGSRRPLTEQIEQESGGQPRDPQTGQFQSPDDRLARFGSSPQTHQIDDPGTIDPPPPAEEPPAEQETPQEREVRLLAGRFPDTPEGREQLARSYQELEQRQGQSSEEMNQLRSTVEDLQRRVYQPPTAAPVQQAPMTQEQIEAGVQRNGREFLASLYENEHPSYDDAIEVALAVNPRLALDWTSDVKAWEAEQRIRAELAERDARLNELSVGAASVAGRDTWNTVWRDMASKNPELNSLGEKMLKDLQENQWLTAPIQQGLPDAERKVIENLLARARDANRGRVDQAQREQAEEIGREKVAATVASGSGSTAALPAGETGSGNEADERVNRLKQSILRTGQGQNVHEAIHGATRT